MMVLGALSHVRLEALHVEAMLLWDLWGHRAGQALELCSLPTDASVFNVLLGGIGLRVRA